MSDAFNLDNAVESGEGVEGEDFPTSDLEASEEGFQVEEVESESTEGASDSDESTSTAQPKNKGPKHGELPASEFAFDATPKPRAAASGEGKSETKTSTPKDALPDGWVTPTQLTNILRERRIVDLKPQQMYGHVKNGKNFPWLYHTDGRYIVPLEDAAAQGVEFGEGEKKFTSDVGGLSWIVNHYQARNEREAKKAAAAEQQESQEAAEVETVAVPTPEVGGTTETADFQS